MVKKDLKRRRRMIVQTDRRTEIKKLNERRRMLVCKLKTHFCLPIKERNYKNFENVVDELEDLRSKIRMLRGNR